MRFNTLSSLLLVASGLAATPALADDPTAPPSAFTVTGSAAVVSQYRFRGISQSDNRPAVQGSFTIAHSSGFYISTWGSSATADSAKIVDIGGTEIDVYGGWTHALGKTGVTFDGGVYGYIYPGGTKSRIGFDASYYEVYGSLSKTYGPITAKVGLNWAPKQHYFKQFAGSGLTQYNMYEYGELGFAVPHTAFTIHSHLGHTGGGLNYLGGTKEYLDYTVGVGYKWKALTFDISVVGTNVSRSDANAFSVANAAANGGVGPSGNSFYRLGKVVPVGSITASF